MTTADTRLTIREETVPGVLLAAAATAPDTPAVVEQDGATTYGELRALAEEYAGTLTALGVGVGDRVVVESDTSACAVALFAACGLVGAVFCPVGPDTPAERLLSIVEACDPVLHLRPAGAREGLPVASGRFDRSGIAASPVRSAPGPRRAVVCTDPAYIIFTSGTTGRPKGVVMSHRGVTSFYRAILALDLVGPGDRVATASPLQFDFALLDIGLTLGSGAALVPLPRALLRWPRRLLAFLAETRVTQVDGVPSVWRQVLKHEPDGLAALTSLRGILFSGERFPLPDLRRLRDLRPGIRVVNVFGPTEAMAFTISTAPDPLPEEALAIGDAYAGAEITLLDEDGALVTEPGAVGEIHFRGPSLFTGYWDDPAATAATLVPDPLEPRTGQLVYRSGDLASRGLDGALRFHGRVDLQVKIRGNRVELGEVERRLLSFPGVASAAAVVRHRDGADPELWAFVVAGGGRVDELELSAHCMRAMPDYMVPRRVRVLEELPVNANGKVDRKALLALLD